MGAQVSLTDLTRLRLRQGMLAALDEVGGRIEDSIAQRISNAYPPASAPGESPHRRTGALRAGVGHHVEQTEGGARLVIFVERQGADPAVPAYLEGGTSRMAARPFMAPARDEWLPVLPEQLRTLYQQNVGVQR
jgi:hypothetical protein